MQRRSIILGAGPSGEIEGSIWIDSGLGQHRFAKDRGDLVVRSHILQEGGLNTFPEASPMNKLASIQLAERQIKVDKLAQAIDSNCRLKSLGLRYAQGVDDDRRIPEPVKEIVGVGIVSGRNRRGKYRSWSGTTR